MANEQLPFSAEPASANHLSRPVNGVRSGAHSLADIAQPTEQVSRGRIVVWHITQQAECLGAHLGAISVFERRAEPSDVHAQAVIILQGTQLSPTRQVPLAEVHTTDERQATPRHPIPRPGDRPGVVERGNEKRDRPNGLAGWAAVTAALIPLTLFGGSWSVESGDRLCRHRPRGDGNRKGIT
jgi:hypothetical protein